MSESLTADPLIDEIREIRKELGDRFDNDVDKLCDYLLTLEATVRDRLVNPPPSHPTGAER